MDRQIPKKEQRKQTLIRAAKWIVPISAIAAFGIFATYKMGTNSIDASKLKFSEVSTGNISISVPASGNIVPAYEQIINSPISSKILTICHRAGDVVEAGEPLLVLDLEAAKTEVGKQEDLLSVKQLEMEQQRANDETAIAKLEMQIQVGAMRLKQLEQEWLNEKYLDSIGSGTTDKVRQAKFALESARLEQEQLKVQTANERLVRKKAADVKRLEIEILAKETQMARKTLGDARILSPARATITSIAEKVGTQIQQGQQVAVVADLDQFKVQAEAPENYARSVTTGAPAKIRLSGKTISGHVAAVQPTSVNGLIKFDVVPDENNIAGFRPGTRPDIYVENGLKESVLRIENSNFYSRPGAYSLFVDRGDGTLERRSVTLGQASMDYIEVVDGLKQGERVVLNDMTNYKNENKLKLRQ